MGWYRRLREGVIIKCPLKWQFHDAHDVILTSVMAVRELVDNDNDNDNEWSLVVQK